MRQVIIILSFFFLINFQLFAQDKLQAGPMVGYSTMREVALWVQTKGSAEVYFQYKDTTKPSNTYKTSTYHTKKEEAYTAILLADKLMPGHHYTGELYIDGKLVNRTVSFQSQALWQWRTDPPSFKFVAGSCHFTNDLEFDRPGEPYGGEYHIFESIQKRNPDFMLWLGDNIYLRESDWNSKTGILYRYTRSRSLPELQKLLASTHHYAIWDDHDFGPNNSDRSFWNKTLTKEAFKLFWANPNYVNDGITGTFHWADVQFFLLDNRYFRSPNSRVTGERTILGKEQEEWLIDALKNSEANFKFIAIGGQFISNNADFENYAIFNEERNRILRKLREEKIEGVVFLTGDRHHTELSKLKESEHVYPIYDLTTSPMTSGTHAARTEPNSNYVEGTMVNQRNFAEIEVSGSWENRVAALRILDSNGKLIWEKVIEAKNLKY